MCISQCLCPRGPSEDGIIRIVFLLCRHKDYTYSCLMFLLLHLEGLDCELQLEPSIPTCIYIYTHIYRCVYIFMCIYKPGRCVPGTPPRTSPPRIPNPGRPCSSLGSLPGIEVTWRLLCSSFLGSISLAPQGPTI